MAIHANIHIDYSTIKDVRTRNSMHLPRIKHALLRKMAQFIRDEAEKRAPYDATNMTEPHLREQITVNEHGMNSISVDAERNNPRDQWDVALWVHEAVYTPSDPTPGVGRRYLARAVEENDSALNGIVAEFVDDYGRNL